MLEACFQKAKNLSPHPHSSGDIQRLATPKGFIRRFISLDSPWVTL